MARLDVVRQVRSAATKAPTTSETPQILIVTGQSSSASCRLPNKQAAFVEKVLPRNINIETPLMGFPWQVDFFEARNKEPHILVASWRNALQFAYASTNSRFRRGCANLVLPRISMGLDRKIILAASCGYQIVSAAFSEAKEINCKVLLITLGAVGFGKLQNHRITTCHIRGKRDIISTIGSSIKPNLTVDCGHMDYWDHPEIQEKCAGLIYEFLS